MSLHAGSKLIHYEVLGPLGAGAMREEYRARDTKLGRDSVIKALPPPSACDADARRTSPLLGALEHFTSIRSIHRAALDRPRRK